MPWPPWRSIVAWTPDGGSPPSSQRPRPTLNAGKSFQAFSRAEYVPSTSRRQRRHAAEAAMPERQHRRLVLVGGDGAHRGAGPEVGEVVAVDGRETRDAGSSPSSTMSGSARTPVGSVTKLERATVMASCGEQPRQVVGAGGEVDAALAARGDVLQERRVGVRTRCRGRSRSR